MIYFILTFLVARILVATIILAVLITKIQKEDKEENPYQRSNEREAEFNRR